jgi:hypothetical protein
MGLLADFVVASPSDALKHASFVGAGDALPAERFERCEYKNYTSLSLELLWALLLCNEKWDAKRHKLETVSIADGGGSWLFRFPDEFVNLIADLDVGATNRVADTWADHAEVPGDGVDNEPVLLDLKRLAVHAQTNGRNLYLWGSL